MTTPVIIFRPALYFPTQQVAYRMQWVFRGFSQIIEGFTHPTDQHCLIQDVILAKHVIILATVRNMRDGWTHLFKNKRRIIFEGFSSRKVEKKRKVAYKKVDYTTTNDIPNLRCTRAKQNLFFYHKLFLLLHVVLLSKHSCVMQPSWSWRM